MELKTGASLQGGKYKIEKVLGKGGFGITYLAYQKGLNRYVAIKEFFMSDYCNREESTCAVSIPSVGSREMVEKYKSKFVKEAQTIAELDNPHIVPIYDVFEENGTAYYVMKYIGGGSLSSLVKKGVALPLDVALKYVCQVAEALAYCHERNIAHLDVKPGNILIQDGVAILIDFGISKHYNEGGEQTSSTPVGISKGYAPLEQYKRGGVTTFSPVTDIYSLGAVLFRLVTGQTPPDADEVNEDGLPEFPSDVPQYIRKAIIKAMQPKKKDRPQSIAEFFSMLKEQEPISEEFDNEEDTELEDSEDTDVTDEVDYSEEKSKEVPGCEPGKTPSKPLNKRVLYGATGGLLAAVAVVLCILWGISSSEKQKNMYINRINALESTLQRTNKECLEQEHTANKRKIDYNNGILRVGNIEYPMVTVTGGQFMMGGCDKEARQDETPRHQVTLSSYHIGKYEVTQELWEAVMESNHSQYLSARNPVENVTWEECQIFVQKLNEYTKQNFKLPTEAQWEFAAKGGNKSRGYLYSGSNEINKVAWIASNCDHYQEVGMKAPNELGIYDMSGNVAEWCSDGYGLYHHGSQINPSGANHTVYKVYRGGGWLSSYIDSRVTARYSEEQDYPGDHNIGLRLCL